MKPTIEELMNGAGGTPPAAVPAPVTPASAVPAPVSPIIGGTGDKTAPNLEEERQRQQRELEEQQRRQQQSQPKPKTAEEISAEHVAAGRNADGSEKTAEQKMADEKTKKEQEAQAMTEEEEDLALWNSVDKLWGRDLEIEYKGANNEDVHPNSPEGIFLREQAVATRAVIEFETLLERENPRAYAFLLHSQAGRPEQEFWETKTVTLPAFDEFQNSVDLQLRVYQESLRVKGLDDAEIKALTDIAQRDKKLQAVATSAYKATEKAQQDEIARLQQINLVNQKAYDRSVTALGKAIDEEMATGMKIVIPDAKKAEFSQFVRNHISMQDGLFYINQPIEAKNVGTLLDQLYFAFAKGNINDLVQRQAQTQNVVRLRSRQKAAGAAPTSKADEVPRKMTLGEL